MERQKPRIKAVDAVIVILCVIAVTLGATLAFRITAKPKAGSLYYTTHVNTDFRTDTDFVRPVETRDGYVKYEYYRYGDTLECVIDKPSFNMAYTKYTE